MGSKCRSTWRRANGGREIKVVCYVDYAVILSDTADNVQRLLYAFEQSASKFHLRISEANTKSMTISTNTLLGANLPCMDEVLSKS